MIHAEPVSASILSPLSKPESVPTGVWPPEHRGCRCLPLRQKPSTERCPGQRHSPRLGQVTGGMCDARLLGACACAHARVWVRGEGGEGAGTGFCSVTVSTVYLTIHTLPPLPCSSCGDSFAPSAMRSQRKCEHLGWSTSTSNCKARLSVNNSIMP